MSALSLAWAESLSTALCAITQLYSSLPARRWPNSWDDLLRVGRGEVNARQDDVEHQLIKFVPVLDGHCGDLRLCAGAASALSYGGGGRDVEDDRSCRAEEVLGGGSGDDADELEVPERVGVLGFEVPALGSARSVARLDSVL